MKGTLVCFLVLHGLSLQAIGITSVFVRLPHLKTDVAVLNALGWLCWAAAYVVWNFRRDEAQK